MQGSDAELLLRAVANAAESLPEIQAAFRFGSQASGHARTDSDIDVAVLIDVASTRLDARTRLRRVIEALAAHVAADRLDVAILNDAPPALAFQVLKSGKLAFERDRVALHRFRVRTYARHADYESTERFFRDVTRQRALAKASRGRRRGPSPAYRCFVEYLSRLEPFGGMDRQRFIENRNDHHLAERYLHLAIESALDIPYLDVDHGITWDTIRNDLGGLRRLA